MKNVDPETLKQRTLGAFEGIQQKRTVTSGCHVSGDSHHPRQESIDAIVKELESPDGDNLASNFRIGVNVAFHGLLIRELIKLIELLIETKTSDAS